MIDFTVLIPVFNSNAAALIEAVQSIHPSGQTLGRKYRVVLVDDGSTHPSTRQMLDFCTGIPYVEVWPMDGLNHGTPVAYNYGHTHIDTEWVALMGSDDISDTRRFEMQCAHLERAAADGEHIDVLGTQLFSFAHNDIYRRPRWTSAHPYHYKKPPAHTNFYTNHGTVIYRQQTVLDVGMYDPKLRRAQDVDLWGRMVAAGKQIRTLESVLYAWRRFN